MRATGRQRLQRLADELAAEGLVKFTENPNHRRSKLVQLTPEATGATGSQMPDCFDRIDDGCRSRPTTE
jgi:hypothetical protein